MRFLADQDVYAARVQFLRKLGLDVVTAAERGMSRLRGCRAAADRED